MRKHAASSNIARLFRYLSQPTRVEILLAIGTGEACVCHLEALLKLPQAYISQHLMALRQAGILQARRDGRFIYYRLHDLRMLDLVYSAAVQASLPDQPVILSGCDQPYPDCPCPHCTPISANTQSELSTVSLTRSVTES